MGTRIAECTSLSPASPRGYLGSAEGPDRPCKLPIERLLAAPAAALFKKGESYDCLHVSHKVCIH
eukprot:1226191-Prorocentrum_lima.AAC.1